MNNKIVIIGVYFGKFPKNIELWKKSCYCNKDIDFLVFTDQKENCRENNIKYVNMTMKKFSKMASEKLNLNINIKRPYKCCDFKPVYGTIFENYIKKYDFWGHCDFDLIFGDIKKFITDELLEKYDKIYIWGHFSLYRNTRENNERYKLQGSKVGEYKEVFTNDKSYTFDENNGIYAIYMYNNFPVYDERIYADISIIYNRFRLAINDKNYKNQVFYWEKGKIYRAYEERGKIKKDEFIYIHFKERKVMKVNIDNIDKLESFYITNKGFYNKKIGLPNLEHINKYNKYPGIIYEKVELEKFKMKQYIKKIKRLVKKK